MHLCPMSILSLIILVMKASSPPLVISSLSDAVGAYECCLVNTLIGARGYDSLHELVYLLVPCLAAFPVWTRKREDYIM